jgi:tripartite-type tricarboxylate transporter receptor subunit TctC
MICRSDISRVAISRARLFGALGALAIASASPFGAAHAQQDAVAQFYRAKTVNIVIASAPGGGFDAYGRLVARFIGRHIPGSPNVIAQNMPGAGGSSTAYYVANVAPKDGSVIGAIHPAAITDPLIGHAAKIDYDPAKLAYIGNANSDTYVCAVRADAPVKSFADLLKTQALFGASTDAASTREFPTFLNHVLGAKIKLVSGYAGNREVMLAIDRGEISGVCGAGWSSLLTMRPRWFQDGTVKPILQETTKGYPALDKLGVPKASDFAQTDDQRRMMELFYSQEIFGRPFMMSPQAPPERIEAMRRAFIETMRDPDLVAQAKTMGLDVDALSGAELQKIVADTYATPRRLVEQTRAAIGGD